MSAIPLVIWLPGAHGDCHPRLLQCRDVVHPVADHRHEPAALRQGRDQRLLLLGPDAAEDRVLLRDSSQRGPVVGKLITGHDSGSRRDTDGGGDRGDGLLRVARDQLQVHLPVAHVSNGLARIGPQGLLEHDQCDRSDRRRRVGVGVVGQAARGAPEGDDPAPGLRVRLEAPLQRHGQRQGAAADQHVGGAEHVGLAPPEGQSAPLPLGGEGNLGPDPLAARRVVLGDRLQRPVALPGAGRESSQGPLRPACLLGIGDVHRNELELAGGQRPGLVDTDRVDRRQRLGRAHLLHEGVETGEPDSGHGERDAHQQDQPLGDQGDQARGGGLRRLVERGAAGLEREDQNDRERDHQPGARLQHEVHLVLEGRGRVPEGARLAGDLLRVAVLANRVDLVIARAGDAERARERPLARLASGRRPPRR